MPTPDNRGCPRANAVRRKTTEAGGIRLLCLLFCVIMIGWMVFGLFVGLVAKLLVPGRDPGGVLMTMLLGIAGGFLGGMLGRAAGLYQEGDSVGFVMAVIGAVILILLHRAFMKRSPV